MKMPWLFAVQTRLFQGLPPPRKSEQLLDVPCHTDMQTGTGSGNINRKAEILEGYKSHKAHPAHVGGRAEHKLLVYNNAGPI